MAEIAKYGVQTTFYFPLVTKDAADFITGATHASGDTKLIKDGGASANTTNGFTDEGNGFYSIVLTATEMQAARLCLTIVDQGTKAWEDQAVVIQTHGNAAASLVFDLDQATPNVNVSTISSNAITAAAVASDAVTEIQSGLATASALTTVAGYLDTEIAAILADTNELQTDWANGGRLDLILDARASQTSVDTIDGIVDAILVDTEEIGAAGAGLTALASQTSVTTIDTVVDAIKVTTDKLDTALELDGAVYRYTANALEEAPTGSGGGLDAAGVRAAIGLASANLDTQLSAIDTVVDALDTSVADLPTNSELATALATADDAVLAQIALIKAKTDPLSFTVAGMVDANIQYVNDVEVTGNGQTGTEWGPV